MARTPVLLRLHTASPAQIARADAWRQEMAGKGYDLTALVDTTHAEGVATVSALRTAAPRMAVATFTIDEVAHRYPQVFADLPPLTKVRGARSPAYSFVTEPLLYWAFGGAGNATLAGARWVWMLEKDLGFSGSVGDWLAAADLAVGNVSLVTPVPLERRTADDKLAQCKRALVKRLGWGRKRFFYKALLQVTRLSLPLLHALDEYSARGVSGDTHIALPTIALKLARRRNFTTAALPPALLGEPFTYNGRVDEERWRALRAEQAQAGGPGKVFHGSSPGGGGRWELQRRKG